MNTKEKGNQLETAIEQIERTILRKYLDSKKSEILIERNKRSKKNGVGDEADLLITINPNTDYESKFLFECKNWKNKITKNEVIIFNDKVTVHNAVRGFLVGKNFNSGAINKIKSFPRIELLQVNDDIRKLYNEIIFHLMPSIYNDSMRVFLGKPLINSCVEISSKDVLVNENGQQIDLAQLITELLNDRKKLYEECKDYFDKHPKKGHNKFQRVVRYHIDKAKFKDKLYNDLFILLQGEIFVYEEKLISRYDVEKKGRYSVYEYLDKDGVLKTITRVDVQRTIDSSNKLITAKFDPHLNGEFISINKV